MIDTSTPEGREQRRRQLEVEAIAHHKRMTREKGDYHWRMANMLTGDGDYAEHDHGEPPKGALWQ